MSVVYLRLKQYLPLQFQSNIEDIEITPSEVVQLVVGPNGSGKSALKAEWSPLPFNEKSYGEEGLKEVHYRIHDTIYKLICEKKGKHAKYQFILNGVNMNESAKVTEQRELVEKHLGYTDDIHRLLIGDILFTELSEDERRKWLTKVCPLDFSLTEKLYKHFRELNRDTKAIGKHLHSKSIAYAENLLSLNNTLPEDIDEQLRDLQAKAETFHPFIRRDLPTEESVNAKLRGLIQEIGKIGRVWDHYRPYYAPNENVTNIDEMNFYLGQVASNIKNLQSDLCRTDEEISKIQELSYQVISGLVDEETLIDRLKQIKAEMQELGVTGHPLYKNHASLLKDIDEWTRHVNDSYNNYQEFSPLSVEEFNRYRDEADGYHRKLSSIEDRRLVVGQRIEHLKASLQDAKQVHCPRCSAEFSINGEDYMREELEKYMEELPGLDDTLSKLRQNLSRLNGVLTDHNAAMRSRDALFEAVCSCPTAVELPSKKTVTENSHVVTQLTAFVRKQVAVDEIHTQLQSEYEQCNAALMLYDDQGRSPSQRLVSLIEQRKQIASKIDAAQKAYARADEARNVYTKMQQAKSRIEEIISSFTVGMEMYTHICISDNARQLHGEVMSRLTRLQDSVTKRDQLAEQKAQLDREMQQAEIDQMVYQFCVDGFSPVKGISAEQLYIFMNTLIGEHTAILKQLWLLDMKVMPCKLDDNGTLDAIFPLNVSGSVVNDIRNGSKGQKSVINFAFTLALRNLLGLAHLPLFMDEIGIDFDEGHKRHLMVFAHNVVQQGLCSQIYLVNHYIETQSALANNEMIILDTRNVVIPSDYRTSAVITNI